MLTQKTTGDRSTPLFLFRRPGPAGLSRRVVTTIPFLVAQAPAAPALHGKYQTIEEPRILVVCRCLFLFAFLVPCLFVFFGRINQPPECFREGEVKYMMLELEKEVK